MGRNSKAFEYSKYVQQSRNIEGNSLDSHQVLAAATESSDSPSFKQVLVAKFLNPHTFCPQRNN